MSIRTSSEVGMDHSMAGEHFPVLQLLKWNPPLTQLNLSEFREAFMSPTRELLLLLSNQREALMLPLFSGNRVSSKDPESQCRESGVLSCPGSLDLPSFNRSDLEDNLPSTSGSIGEPNNDTSYDCGYSFISGLNSLAWGACGDSYNHNQDAPFKDLLFVSGSHGVIVHAFCHHDSTNEKSELMPEFQLGEGRWMEWGPRLSSEHSNVGDVSCNNDSFHEAVHDNRTKGMGNGISEHFGPSDFSSTAPKRWLRSFLIKVETQESHGNFDIRFPVRSSFPHFAKIVSFDIFGDTSPSSEFLAHSNHADDYESDKVTIQTGLDDSAAPLNLRSVSHQFKSAFLSKFLGVGPNCVYSCSRVFSSNSHNLVGFVLSLVDLVPITESHDSESVRWRNFVVVAQLYSWGLRYLSFVKLGENVDMQKIEWVDFCFSDDLLVCLSASGLLSFYAVISGKLVSQLDIIKCCGFGFKLSAPEEREMQGGAGIRDQQEKQTFDLSSPNSGRKFKKLMSASFTALLAAVDEIGLTYVICAAEYLPVKCYSSMKLLPNCKYSEFGSFAGWEIGGSDIGHQLPYLWNYDEKLNNNDVCGSGFSSIKMNKKRQELESPLKFKRSILFPVGGFSEDDCLSFSTLGIIRLTKKRINGQYGYKIVHHNLRVDAEIQDDRCLNLQTELIHLKENEETIVEAVGCSFQGCLYIVMQSGLSVVIPSMLASSQLPPSKSVGNQEYSHGIGRGMGAVKNSKLLCSPWIMEVLDRCILYEGPDVADHLCLENGWHVRVSRLRRLQLSLEYLKFDEIEQSLEMLAGVGLAEEAILRVLFRAAYLMFGKVGNDHEVSAASRLLTLASSFATKIIQVYGSLQQNRNGSDLWDENDQLFSFFPFLSEEGQFGARTSKTLHELAYLLEIVRGLQCRLVAKLQRPGQGLADTGEGLSLVPMDSTVDEFELSIVPADPLSLKASNHIEFPLSMPSFAPGSNDTDNLSLKPFDYLEPRTKLGSDDLSEASALVAQVSPALGDNLVRNILPLENPSEMVARWKMNNLDLKTVVKDALLSGRLPLAVLQLHLHHSRDLQNEEEHHDTFDEVREVGRAIAYDLFLKGETRLAVATLQRLGEDTRTSLKQLLFGTTRRSLRLQIVEEMERCDFLGPFDWKILERLSLIERLYPSSSFWRTFMYRQEEFDGEYKASSEVSDGNTQPMLFSLIYNNMKLECGEVDGIVLGPWVNVASDSSTPVISDDGANGGYWAAAAIWCSLWDQKTIDRIILDQPFLMGVHVLWDSQLEYHMCHNDWEEVARLLDIIPSASLSDRNLQISLDGLEPSVVGFNRQNSFLGDYRPSFEELDAVYMDVPDIKIFRPSVNLSSAWLRTLLEPELARRFIFLREYWEGTSEIVPILARSGFVTRNVQCTLADGSSSPDVKSSTDTSLCPSNSLYGLHKVLIRHCAQYRLPNLLDIYLDHHKLGLDNDSLYPLLEAVGECQWARWLLFSRVKGQEYEASFSNSRAIMVHHSAPSNLSLETEELIQTIDDIAEGGGEFAALATLIYAPIQIQNCLSTGSVKRQSTSAQCTLENLRPTLQHFPTLWRTFVAACLGQDPSYTFSLNKGINVFSSSTLSEFLTWRENIFCSADRDASLMQMLPCWFPKAVRRLVQLYSEGPLVWQSIGMEYLPHRDIDLFINSQELSQISSINWEAALQRRIEEELYDSALKETGLGLEQHLHRGRALAAFNHLLSARVQKLKLESQSGDSDNQQTNVNLDVQTLLAPLTESEESLLAPVMPLAVAHFENPVLVASCSFLLELCGFSTCMLRIDVAALRRISSFYKSIEDNENYKELSPKGSAFHSNSRGGDITKSLARALADGYLQQDYPSMINNKETSNPPLERTSRALMLVLQHLEKASLPSLLQGKTSGSWLLDGDGDGTELRSQQKAASQSWSLVTAFCQMHHIPLSTKYLAVLARDNDWVGFLSEAQIGGYPFDVLVQVASKEFDDPRLKLHILTVMKSMHSRRKTGASSYVDDTEKKTESAFPDEHLYIPVELFEIIAECEKKKHPGEALLLRAKDLSWSILAMIASCFTDVSPLDCLTVWLEITAARETSSIKVNDIASQIANNVAAAVESTNFQATSARVVTFHYNRRNSKRRRLMESVPVGVFGASVVEASSSPSGEGTFATQTINAGEDTKVQIGAYATFDREIDEGPASLSKMVAVLCEQQLYLPLLRAFEMFLPSCSLLPFIRALQAFSQMRLSEASAHLGSFSIRIKEEPAHSLTSTGKEERIASSWVSSTAVKAADAVLSTCPSPYEKRCLLQLLASTDFGDGGHGAAHYRRLYWKINLAEPSLRKDNLHLGSETLDDASLLKALEENGHWEQARNWARQLEASGGPWKSTAHHVTETQAESMVAEWREFLWDVPEERVSLWGHCQTLFIRYSFPPLQAGTFFLKQAEALEKDLPARELHDLLLLSLQWLSGMITLSQPVYPLHLLREIETRVWLLAVESEAQMKSEGDFSLSSSNNDNIAGYSSGMIDRTANIITKMDNHMTTMRNRMTEKNDARDNSQIHVNETSIPVPGVGSKAKRRAKAVTTRRTVVDTVDKSTDQEDGFSNLIARVEPQPHDDNVKIEVSFSKWEETVGPEELERAVLSLLEFGQISAAKQLQHKLSPTQKPSEFFLVDAAVKLAAVSTPWSKVPLSVLDSEVQSVIRLCNIPTSQHLVDPFEVLESLTATFTEGRGRGLFKRIIAVAKTANMLGLTFSEAFTKQPIEILQLLSLKAQDSFEVAKLLVQTHPMPAASIAKILAESFLKGLLAAHRGGYLDSQKEEGPAPLLWRFLDFLKWAELCPSEPEIGHALMRLVITGQEIPHTCEVELLILSHHFYKSSACLDGVDVLVALAANKVDAYVSEGDFTCLARLITGVGNFHALHFILGILIENGQLNLLLQKYSSADVDSDTGDVRGFRMAVLTTLKQFNPNDVDAFAMVYHHFVMKHETAALLESRAVQASETWLRRNDTDQNEDLLESMRLFIEAGEVYSSIDEGNNTRRACAQASLVSLQIRMPDFQWMNLTETNARRALVEQVHFPEALIVAEAYGLNQPSEWALMLWNQMLNPELIEEFMADFVGVLPLQPAMLLELARFYRAEISARGDQSQFSLWLTGGGIPAEWAKYLARSFRCLLKKTRDLKLRLQMATIATGLGDVVDSCVKGLDRVPDNAGPLVLRRGHGGAYLPLM